MSTPRSVPGGKPPETSSAPYGLSPRTELGLVRHAIAAKGAQKRTLEEVIQEKSRIIEFNERSLTKLAVEKESIAETLNLSQSEIVQLRESVQALQNQLETVSADKAVSIEHLDEERKAKEALECELDALKQSSKQTFSSLELEKIDCTNLFVSLSSRMSWMLKPDVLRGIISFPN
jgi:chromosome segregation ATPase